jgi:protein TonB
MFKDSFLDDRAESRRPWTVAVSLLAQSLAIALVALASLLTAGDLPAGQWMAHLLAPPPMPPAAAPPEPAQMAPAAALVQRFDDSTLLTPAAIPEQIAMVVDPPSRAPSVPGIPGVVSVPGTAGGVAHSVLSQLAAVRVAPPPPAKPEPAPQKSQEPVRVSSDLQAARLIHKVAPVYPELAIRTRVSGVVRLEAIIGEDGAIRQLRVLSGHPLLVPNARDAVSRWRYRPTLLGGVAVPVVTLIDVNFTLAR